MSGRRRNKLANQVQKAIRGGYGDKVKLPEDPFQGFRDPEPKSDLAVPPRSKKSLALESQGVGIHPGSLASLGIPTYVDRRTPEMKEADAARFRESELIRIAKEHAAANPVAPARNQAQVDATHAAQLEAAKKAEHDEPNAAMKSASTEELKAAEKAFAERVARSGKGRPGTSAGNANWEDERHLAKLRTELERRGVSSASASPRAVDDITEAAEARATALGHKPGTVGHARAVEAAMRGDFESAHPRHPAGTSQGGEFRRK